jgi:hypothetical protein
MESARDARHVSGKHAWRTDEHIEDTPLVDAAGLQRRSCLKKDGDDHRVKKQNKEPRWMKNPRFKRKEYIEC